MTDWMKEMTWLPSLTSTLLCVLWGLLAFVGWRFLYRWARDAWPRVREAFGPYEIRTFALIGAALLFIFDIPKIVETLIRLAYSTVLRIPLNVLEHNQAPEVKPDSINTLALLFKSLFAEMKYLQETLPYVSLALFFIVWFVLGQLLRLFFPSQKDAQSEHVQALSRMIREFGATRGLLVALLVAGLTLCIAAITAVSELGDNSGLSSPLLTREQVAEKLKSGEDSFVTVYPYESKKDDALSLLRTRHDELKRSLPAEPQNPLMHARQQLLSPVDVGLIDVQTGRSLLTTVWANLVNTSQGIYNRAVADALTEYEVGYNSIGSAREKRQHFREILQWHNLSRLQLRTAIESCRSEILAAEKSWNDWATSALLQLENPRLDGLGLAESKFNRARCALPEKLDPAPTRAPLGDALGPLKPIAGWLLRTESVQLALIIGMLGAGLLGSAVATFLRNQRHQEVKAQLAGVLVRGVTAAIVVFLAAQGGLSTLALGTGGEAPRPNPYILLLVCFVASVYSEQVWKAALKRLEKQLGSEDDAKLAGASAQSEQKQQPAPAAEAGNTPASAVAPPPVNAGSS